MNPAFFRCFLDASAVKKQYMKIFSFIFHLHMAVVLSSYVKLCQAVSSYVKHNDTIVLRYNTYIDM